MSSWQNKIKIDLIIQELLNIKTKFVMGIDSFDAVFLGNPQEAVNIFKKNNCRILFNAVKCRPPIWNGIFESLDNICNIAFPKSLFRYFNAGAWIGEHQFCIDFFKESKKYEEIISNMVNVLDIKYKFLANSEQFITKFVFEKNFGAASVDHNCEIFQTLQMPIDNCLKLIEDNKKIY